MPRPVSRLTSSYWPAGGPGTGTGEDGTVHDTTVGGILRAAAAHAPQTTALVAAGSGGTRRRWTYLELLRDAESAAAALLRRFRAGERVAVWAPSLPASLVLTYGAGLAGIVLVPVNPALRAGELVHVLGQSQTAGLFFARHWRDGDQTQVLDEVRPQVPSLREVVELDAWELCTSSHGESPEEAPDADAGPRPDDVAQLVYTSGTTGAPKGALLTHRGMTNAARLAALRFGMRAGDVYVHTMPLYHVGGQVVAMQLCQSAATTVLLESFDAGSVLELIEGERATLTCGVPTMLQAMMEHPDFGRRDLTSLRAVSGGGAVVPVAMVRDVEEALGVRFAVVFGQTETCGFISQTHLDDADEDKAATLGRPLPGIEARVVGPGGSGPLPTGTVGELEVRGPNVMVGYHDAPEETASALASDGWLRTGDLVTMDDRGYLRMVGRSKDMIVSGGENLYPAEIEEALLGHPAVAQVAVVGVPDHRWGEAAVAFVRRSPDGEGVAGAELEQFLRGRLAAFKVPRRWCFVDAFPLTASGKVRKFALRDRALARAGPLAADTADAR